MTPPRLIALILLTALSLPAQQNPRQPADPVIRVTVDLVQVDAVVTDSKGRHVPDLKREDFEILEDGKPQKVTHFSYLQGNSVTDAPKAHRRETSGEAVLAPPKPLRPEEVRRTIVLLADDLGLSADDVVAVRSA